MLSAMLRALAQAVGEARDRGRPRLRRHPQRQRRPRRTARRGSPRRRSAARSAPYGANRHGDADSQMLSYQANGIGVAVEAVEADAPVVVLRHEIVPDTAGPGRNRGGASMLRDSLWLRARPASPDVAALQAPARLRRRTAAAAARPAASGSSMGTGDARPFALGPELLRRRDPVGGVLDPRRSSPRATASTTTRSACRSGRPGRARSCATSTARGGGWGDPLERDPERGHARRPRRLRDDRGRGARLRRRRRPAIPSSIRRGSCSTCAATERLRSER